MNRTITTNFVKRTIPGLRRSCCMLAALPVVLLTVGPAQADPIQVNRVVQTLKTVQGTTNIQLTLLTQDPIPAGTKPTATGPGGVARIGSNDPKLDALLSGFPIVTSSVDLGVDDVEEDGEVDGTICDCGEILVAGGFPKWPLLFLAAVPLAFIPDCDNCEQNEPTPTPTPTPPSTPTPTPTPTPEPASLLLFGTGLVAAGAGLRRHYNKAKPAAQIESEEEQS